MGTPYWDCASFVYNGFGVDGTKSVVYSVFPHIKRRLLVLCHLLCTRYPLFFEVRACGLGRAEVSLSLGLLEARGFGCRWRRENGVEIEMVRTCQKPGYNWNWM